MALLLTDDQIADRLDAKTAVAAMRSALLAEHRGELTAPPRAHLDLGEGRLAITAGRFRDRYYGFRSYDTLGLPEGDQVVVLLDGRSGRVRVIALGATLGSARTGAIGAVAVAALARPDAATLGVVGAGGQAWTQVWATTAVRPLREVLVHSRTAAGREAFAARVRDELGIPATAVDSAAAAVRDRDIVVLATTSVVPVIAAADLAPGTHVNAVGFKQRGRAEFGLDLLDRAGVLATDSIAQADAYVPPLQPAGTAHAARLTALGAILAGEHSGRRDDEQVSVFLSVGLAGTEVALLAALVDDGRSPDA